MVIGAVMGSIIGSITRMIIGRLVGPIVRTVVRPIVPLIVGPLMRAIVRWLVRPLIEGPIIGGPVGLLGCTGALAKGGRGRDTLLLSRPPTTAASGQLRATATAGLRPNAADTGLMSVTTRRGGWPLTGRLSDCGGPFGVGIG